MHRDFHILSQHNLFPIEVGRGYVFLSISNFKWLVTISIISIFQVIFETDNNNVSSPKHQHKFSRALSIDQELHLEHIPEDEALSGEDLGFEEGDVGGEECECGPCVRLAAWEELVGVAIPLLEKLRPPKTDASVGTDY